MLTCALLGCLSADCVHAQLRFNSAHNNQPIPDFDIERSTRLDIPIEVSGISGKTGGSFGLETVQIAIKHPQVSDVKVVLYSPSGTEVWITNRNGRDGQDYMETRFSATGYRGLVSEGVAPFIGEYIPDGQLSYFNDGQDPNGVWTLRLFDLKAGDVGIFNSASLFFGNKPAVGIASPCSFATAASCGCPAGQRHCELLPDLVPNATVVNANLFEKAFDPQLGKGQLLFAFETMNIGFGPFEMQGSGKWYCERERVAGSVQCPDGAMSRLQMMQIIYHLKKGKLRAHKRLLGSIAYDRRPGHEHFHLDDFVAYELLEKTEGSPNQAEWRLVGKGNKASFCIWDLGWCRDDLNNCRDKDGRAYGSANLRNYGLGGKFRACNADMQGLSVGGTDLYGENYEGQSLDLPDGICNGTYWLRIVIDPKNTIRESDKVNNTILVPVEIKKQKKCG